MTYEQKAETAVTEEKINIGESPTLTSFLFFYAAVYSTLYNTTNDRSGFLRTLTQRVFLRLSLVKQLTYRPCGNVRVPCDWPPGCRPPPPILYAREGR
jgi:hypothetical protein